MRIILLSVCHVIADDVSICFSFSFDSVASGMFSAVGVCVVNCRFVLFISFPS